jgi:hypothetical protein
MPNETKPNNEQGDRQRSSRYPGFNLKRVEEITRLAFVEGPRNLDQDRFAQLIGYSNSKNGAYARLRSAAVEFGALKSSGSGAISVSEEWIAAFMSDDPKEIVEVLKSSVKRPTLYQQIFKAYENRQFPTVEKLSRELYVNPQYGVLKDAAEVAAQIFLESAKYAGLIDARGFVTTDNQLVGDKAVGLHISDTITASQTSTNATSSVESRTNTVFPAPDSEGIDRIEINLSSRRKAVLLIPVPLSKADKTRIKKFVDLLLEEDEPASPIDDDLTGDER